MLWHLIRTVRQRLIMTTPLKHCTGTVSSNLLGKGVVVDEGGGGGGGGQREA